MFQTAAEKARENAIYAQELAKQKAEEAGVMQKLQENSSYLNESFSKYSTLAKERASQISQQA